MTTPTSDPQTGTFMLPRAFPTLRRDEHGDLIWTATAKARTDELSLYLGYRLWKLWNEIQDVREFARFMALVREETPDLPAWLVKHGPLPPWVTAVPGDDYMTLDREQNGDGDEEEAL
jgi:hypothetical protein